jgi:hypothetical protein
MTYLKNIIIKALFKIYNLISTKIESFFLQKEKKNSIFLVEGFEFIKLGTECNLQNFVEQTVCQNQYFHRLILKKNSFIEILKLIFLENNLSQYISSITGYNFSVDFALAYSTTHIENENKEKSIYANLWHRDKPFSENTLKLIIPLNKIDNNYGPMQIINKAKSLTYTDDNINNEINLLEYAEVVGDTKTIFLFNPNICFHRAGIPDEGKIRSQLMLQLNPSKHWQYSNNLYNNQFKIEPKFPMLNIFDKKIILNDKF